MHINKRKIFLWLVCALFAVAFFLVLANLVATYRAANRAQAFTSRHADAPKRAARTVTQFFEAARMNMETTAPRVMAARHPVAVMTTATLSGEIRAIDQDYTLLHRAFNKKDDWRLIKARQGGIGGVMLYLPAGDFPEEGASGPLRGGEALRARIRKEVLENGKIFDIPSAHHLAHKTTQTLARQAAALVDRTADLLRYDWSTTTSTPLAYSVFYQLAPLAVERQARQGRLAEAGDLLERFVRLELLARLKQFPVRLPLWTVQRMALHLAEEQWIDDATLARVDRLLAGARLTEAQLADLRATAAVRTIQEFEDHLKRIGSGDHSGEYQRLLNGFSRQGTRILLMPLYQALLAWAAGDGAAYDKALRGPLAMTFILPRVADGGFCPPELASFNGESAANDDLDLTRLIVAAARYHLAQGRYPTQINELIPSYLSPGSSPGGAPIRAVEWLANTNPSQDGKGVNGRPVFYLARRMTLSPIRLVSLWGYGDRFRPIDQTGLLKSSAGGDLLSRLDFTSGRMLNLMSSRTVEAIVVWAVWPRTEEVDWGWLDGVQE